MPPGSGSSARPRSRRSWADLADPSPNCSTSESRTISSRSSVIAWWASECRAHDEDQVCDRRRHAHGLPAQSVHRIQLMAAEGVRSQSSERTRSRQRGRGRGRPRHRHRNSPGHFVAKRARRVHKETPFRQAPHLPRSLWQERPPRRRQDKKCGDERRPPPRRRMNQESSECLPPQHLRTRRARWTAQEAATRCSAGSSKPHPRSRAAGEGRGPRRGRASSPRSVGDGA